MEQGAIKYTQSLLLLLLQFARVNQDDIFIKFLYQGNLELDQSTESTPQTLQHRNKPNSLDPLALDPSVHHRFFGGDKNGKVQVTSKGLVNAVVLQLVDHVFQILTAWMALGFRVGS